jgi:hypothetical protein
MVAWLRSVPVQAALIAVEHLTGRRRKSRGKGMGCRYGSSASDQSEACPAAGPNDPHAVGVSSLDIQLRAAGIHELDLHVKA